MMVVGLRFSSVVFHGSISISVQAREEEDGSPVQPRRAAWFSWMDWGDAVHREQKRFVPPTPCMGVASGAENAGLLIIVVVI